MLSGNSLFIERIQTIDFVIVVANPQSGTAAKAVHKRLPLRKKPESGTCAAESCATG
jgi:hypothetical protein